MGWAKYTEDNYEAFLERQALKGGDDKTKNYSHTNTTAKLKPKEKSNFTEMFAGESCFSF